MDIFDVEIAIPLPLSDNSLFFQKKEINGYQIIYLSLNSDLSEIKKYVNINIKMLLDDNELLKILFKDDYKIIVGMICSPKPNITFLVDYEYLDLKLPNEYLIEPKFITKSLFGCNGNNFKDGIPLDPVSLEPILEEEKFILGNACYFKDTIKSIINSRNPVDPLNREPIPQEIIDMFKNPDYVTLRGHNYEIEDNAIDLGGKYISDITPLSHLTFLEILGLDGALIVDISPLSKLTNLNRLSLSRIKFSDISPLQELKKLEFLDISKTKVSDITALSNLIFLETLNLRDYYHD